MSDTPDSQPEPVVEEHVHDEHDEHEEVVTRTSTPDDFEPVDAEDDSEES